jgi:hypothetical protein
MIERIDRRRPSGRVRRRDLLRVAAVAAVGGPVAVSRGAPPAVVPEDRARSAMLEAGALTAVIGDNSAAGEHRGGYNGVWSLRHAAEPRSLFVPAYAGLNLEHIVTGEQLDDEKVFYEPRNVPLACRSIGAAEAELHQPPTPTFHVESWARFRLIAPHYLDMSFRCMPHRPVFPRGYLAFFWASYIAAPADKSMYFLGGPEGQGNQWTQLCTQRHGDESTVRHRDDAFEMTFPPGGRDALFKSLSPLRFDRPFFYGHRDELVWIVMFDRTAGIRFTHSPTGGGWDAARRTANPAWDFQFVVRNPEVTKEYGFHIRTVLRPRCSREEILEEVGRWQPRSGVEEQRH